MQVDPRLTAWVKTSLTNFCCCPDEKSYLQTSQEINPSNGQQWLLENLNSAECSPTLDQLLSAYCVCTTSGNKSSQSVKPSKTAEPCHEKHQLLAVSEPKRNDESKVASDSKHKSHLKTKGSRCDNPKKDGADSVEEFTLARSSQNYKTRKDLVYKAALRRMRKYFIQDFKEATKHSLPETDYPSRLREYCAAKFPESNTDRALVVFDCIINSKGKLGAIPSEDRDLKNLTEKLMYFYSEKMFKRMRTHPEFLEALLHFLSIEGVSNLIYSDNRVSFQRKVKTHLHKLKERTLRMLPSASE
ncbi:unnamed protein product [Moneuplotes crassus]|uniref:Uncharacterized protein n=1 Tax=Euplotes crassus TaxID=5936 RepID=A0AAD1XZ33_EUPCR|nr:unnamed protein product [Moneuplotes crassus]